MTRAAKKCRGCLNGEESPGSISYSLSILRKRGAFLRSLAALVLPANGCLCRKNLAPGRADKFWRVCAALFCRSAATNLHRTSMV